MPNYQGPSGLSKQFLIYGGSDSVPVMDFTDWIDWEKAELAMAASNGESTTSTLTLRDEDGALPDNVTNMSIRAHNVATLTVGSNTIWRGRVIGIKSQRGRQPAYRARELEVTFADYNADLNGIVVHDWARPAETDVQRAQALVAAYLSASPRATTNLNGSNYVSSSNTISLDPDTFTGLTPGEVLIELASDSDKEMFVTVDGQLFYDGHDSTVYNSLLRISDNDNEGDAVTYAPDKDATGERFLREQITALRSYWGPEQTDTVRVTNTAAAELDYWEDIWYDERAQNITTATRRAQHLLNYQAKPDSSYSMTIGPMNGHEVWKIKAGQLINFRDRGIRGGRDSSGNYLGNDYNTARIREVRWSFPGVDEYVAHLELDRARMWWRPRNNPVRTQTVATATQLCTETNILLHQTGSALKVSSTDGGNTKDRACNGITAINNHWSNAQANGVDEAYWAADLGAAQRISAYRILQGYTDPDVPAATEPEGASEMILYGSDSSSAWSWLPSGNLVADPAANGWTLITTIVGSTTGSDSGRVNVTPVSYRYYLLRASVGPSPGTGTGWNIQEFELWNRNCTPTSTGDSSDSGDSGTAADANHTHAHGTFASGDYHTEYVREAILTNAGDMPYATAASTWTRRAIGGSNTHLTSDGTAPIWMPNTGGGLTDHDHTAAGDGGDLTAALISNYLNFTDQTSAPSTPAAGKTILYSSNSQFYLKNSGGTVARVVSADIANAKGDLFAATADNEVSRLAAGSNGTILSADSTQSAGLKWISPASGSILLGGNLGDVPPTSPGTYDEEFTGTADTLPSGWSWASAPSGSDAWYLNSRWPGMLTVEGTGNTAYTLTRTSFSAAATFGVWAHLFTSAQVSADSTYMRMRVSDSTANNTRSMDFDAQSAGQNRVRSLRVVGGAAEAVETAFSFTATAIMDLYVGMWRDGSNNWSFWYSSNGIGWTRLGSTASHTFTIDRIELVFKTHSYLSLVGIDWLRYRTDNEFPRI